MFPCGIDGKHEIQPSCRWRAKPWRAKPGVRCAVEVIARFWQRTGNSALPATYPLQQLVPAGSAIRQPRARRWASFGCSFLTMPNASADMRTLSAIWREISCFQRQRLTDPQPGTRQQCEKNSVSLFRTGKDSPKFRFGDRWSVLLLSLLQDRHPDKVVVPLAASGEAAPPSALTAEATTSFTAFVGNLDGGLCAGAPQTPFSL